MNATRQTTKPQAAKRPGRPRTSPLTRQEQLRVAKRAQRARAKALGAETVELRLDYELATMLKAALLTPTFKQDLKTFLANVVVDVNAYPALRDIAWNRRDRWVPAGEAMALYERNWRFVDAGKLQPAEAQLITNLAARFGNGVLHV